MSQSTLTTRSRLERWSPRLFLVAGVMFLLSVAVTVVDIAVGAEQLRLQWGQFTVGLGWIAGLVGLLGLYRLLARWNRWVARLAALFVGIGLIGYAIMTAGIFAIITGLPESDLAPLEPVFLPLMLLGSVLPFPLVGIGCIRSDQVSSNLGVLLIGQSIVFLVNALTPTPATFVLVVLLVLMAVNLGVSHLLRMDSPLFARDSVAPTNESASG